MDEWASWPIMLLRAGYNDGDILHGCLIVVCGCAEPCGNFLLLLTFCFPSFYHLHPLLSPTSQSRDGANMLERVE